MTALVIVAYNGTQVRARSTSRIASARELQKLLAAYTTQEGKYPSTSEACLGAGYTDWDGNGTADCYVKAANPRSTSAALDNELKKVATIPKVETSEIKTASYTISGYIYVPNKIIDGQAGRAYITYYLEGINQNCGLPGVLTIVDYGTGEHATNGAINTLSNHLGATLCQIPILAP